MFKLNYVSFFTSVTYQTWTRWTPHPAVRKLLSCSDGGSLPSGLGPAGLHSFCFHWHLKLGINTLPSLFSPVSRELPNHVTQTVWPLPWWHPPSFVSSSWTPSFLPVCYPGLFTPHYSVQLSGGTQRGGTCYACYTVIGIEWWPRMQLVFMVSSTKTKQHAIERHAVQKKKHEWALYAL